MANFGWKKCKPKSQNNNCGLSYKSQLTIDEFTGIGLQFSRDFGCNRWQSKPSV